jgi:hypothetical protein
MRWPALLLPLLAASPAATAAAQQGVDEGYYDWQPSEPPPPRTAPGGPRTIDDARSSGRGIVIHGYGGGTAQVPDVYQVRRGDTLWDITWHFYGNPWEWPRVWSYNPQVTNPHWIYPDDYIRMRAEGTGPGGALPRGTRRPTRAPEGSVWLRDEGYLDRDALENAGIIIGSPEEQMLLSTWDEVYVRFENPSDARPGAEYTVFREVPEAQRGDDEEGVLVRIFGAVRLRNYDRDRDVGRGVITEALDPIERGYRIAPIPRRFEMVPPRRNDRDLVAEVVAALRPREFHADYQIIFVNVGEQEGVHLGNRFFIVRQSDHWRSVLDEDRAQGEEDVGAEIPGAERPDEYPPEIIAEGRVVNVRPHSAALMVTRSVREVVIGDRAEMRQGF